MAQATMEDEVEITQAFLDHAYACTLCGSCETHCPVGVPLTEIFHAWRVDMVEGGHILPDHERAIGMTKRYLNPYGPKPEEPNGSETPRRQKAKVLFYPGCTTNRMAQETVEAVTEILGKLELDHVLFEDDTCCGFPLYEIGQVEEAKAIAQETLGRILEHGPEVLLTTCPACFKSFRHILPDEMGLTIDFEVQHISEFLLPLVQGKLAETEVKVTWHDPCVLGRHLGMYEEPRDLLKAIPGLELAEMPSNRKDALCCGAGGGVYFTCQRMANQAVVARLEQAVQTEAEQIITSCPNCYVRFRQMSRHHRMKIQAKSLSQVINEALE